MNESNLIPQSQRTKDEQREIARMGGLASGEARREKKKLRDRLLWAGAQQKKTDSSNDEVITFEDEISLQLVQKAADGDLKAIRLYAELTGQFAQRIRLNEEPDEETPQSVIVMGRSYYDSYEHYVKCHPEQKDELYEEYLKSRPKPKSE